MTKRDLMVAFAVAALALGLTGCRAGEGRADGSGKSTVRAADRPILAPAQAAAALDRMLYGENLISVPEVNQRTKVAVLRVARDSRARDSVMPALHRWLEDWAAAHPAQAQAARLAGGGSSPQTRGADADNRSSVRAQTDSIRGLVRERAKRRIEAARLAHGSIRRDAGMK
jgi:hypothetical protein